MIDWSIIDIILYEEHCVRGLDSFCAYKYITLYLIE